MTRKQLRKKVRQLIRTTAGEMSVDLEKAIASGAIDIESAPDDYVLPKTVLLALLMEAQHGMSLPTYREKQIRKEARNIYANI